MVGRYEDHKISSLTHIVFWNNWSRTRPSHCLWISRNKNYCVFFKRFMEIAIHYYQVDTVPVTLVTDLQQTFVLSSTPFISLISWFCFCPVLPSILLFLSKFFCDWIFPGLPYFSKSAVDRHCTVYLTAYLKICQ